MGGDAGEEFNAGVKLSVSRTRAACPDDTRGDHSPAVCQRLARGAQSYVNAKKLARHNRRAGGEFDSQPRCAHILGLPADESARCWLKHLYRPILADSQASSS